MNRHSRSLVILLAAIIMALVGFVSVGTRQAIERVPSIEQIKSLARLGQFERAQALLDRYLRVHSDDGRAHLLMAQLTTEPVAARPRVRSRTPSRYQTGFDQAGRTGQILRGESPLSTKTVRPGGSMLGRGAAAGPDCPRSGLGAGRPSR